MIVKKRLISIYLHIKAAFEARRAFFHSERPLILVYQMGKVGSSTVYNSLRDMGLPNSIHHVHFLSVDLLKYRKAHERAGIFPAPYHMFMGEALRKNIGKRRGFPVKIISMVRDPIALVVSALFENTHLYKELSVPDDREIDPHIAINLLENFFNDPDNFSYVYEWFDKELKEVFDIDVFATPFPIDTGYAYYTKNNVSALVIRTENLSINGAVAIANFLNLKKPLDLQPRNVRSAGGGKAEAYQKVLSKLCINQELCRKIYASRFVRHFYTDEMIDEFIVKWTKADSFGSVRLNAAIENGKSW